MDQLTKLMNDQETLIDNQEKIQINLGQSFDPIEIPFGVKEKLFPEEKINVKGPSSVEKVFKLMNDPKIKKGLAYVTQNPGVIKKTLIILGLLIVIGFSTTIYFSVKELIAFINFLIHLF